MSGRKKTWIAPAAFLKNVRTSNITYTMLEIDPPSEAFTCELCNGLGEFYCDVKSRTRTSGLVLCFDHALLVEAMCKREPE